MIQMLIDILLQTVSLIVSCCVCYTTTNEGSRLYVYCCSLTKYTQKGLRWESLKSSNPKVRLKTGASSDIGHVRAGIMTPHVLCFTPHVSHTCIDRLREEAASLSHLLTHIPKNPYCKVCVFAKTLRTQQMKKKNKGFHIVRPYSNPTSFGGLCTMDHWFVANSEGSRGKA